MISLAEEISRQPNPDTVSCLLVITPMKRDKEAKKKYKMYSVEEKVSTRKFNVGAQLCVQRDERFRKKPDGKWKTPHS